jgi:hypothetical protein
LDRRSLGFARDDKGKGDTPMEGGCRTECVFLAAAFNATAALPFAIPSEAEESAVFDWPQKKTARGNRREPSWLGLRG